MVPGLNYTHPYLLPLGREPYSTPGHKAMSSLQTPASTENYHSSSETEAALRQKSSLAVSKQVILLKVPTKQF